MGQNCEDPALVTMLNELRANTRKHDQEDHEVDGGEVNPEEMMALVGTEQEQRLLTALRAKAAITPSLGDCKLSDDLLLRCLRTRRYDVDVALKLLDGYLDLKRKLGEDTIESLRDVMECQLICYPTGARDRGGRLLSYTRVRYCDPRRFSPNQFIRGVLYALDVSNTSADVQIRGVTGIHDFKDASVRNIDPRIKALYDAAQDNMPLRLSVMIVINAPWWFSLLWSIVKWWFRPKIRRRLVILDNPSQLRDYIDDENLLEEYGGNLKYDAKEWVKERYAAEGLPYSDS